MAGVLFSQNFAYAKFCGIKSLQNAEIILSFTDIGKSCPSPKFLRSQICHFNAIHENKISRKFPDLQYIYKQSGKNEDPDQLEAS